ncbi:MAG: ATP-binding protein [Pseudomonadota bacterium]
MAIAGWFTKDVLKKAIIRYEQFLRIDPQMQPWDLMRSRAVYLVCWMFSGLQGLNLLGMTHTYGGWTRDHSVSVMAIGLFLIIGHGLRWTKSFPFFTLSYGFVCIGGLFIASYGAGINTSLLPFIAAGPLVAAFVGGWRSSVYYYFVCLAILIFQLNTSLTHPPVAPEWTPERTEQRFLQAVFALTMATSVSCLLSAGCEKAFARLERAVKNATHSDRTKSNFLATMSHELRTPMNGVLGLTEALLSEAPGPLVQRQSLLLSHIKSSGEHLLTLLNDLLDLSKIEAGKLNIEPRPFPLEGLVVAVHDTYSEAAVSKGISLTWKIDPELTHWVVGDDQRVRQILNNLVANAIKFTTEGSVHLDVSGGKKGMIAFRVIDTGTGVAKDQETSIFSPFAQGDQSSTRRIGGTGLGLSICRTLATLMKGDIALESTGPEGSTFLVSLPLPGVETAEEASPLKILDGARLDGVRVLVAEDNAVNRMVLAEFLKTWGVHAVFAEDGAEALTIFEAASFDLLLVDRQMPNVDGEGVVRSIRARDDDKQATPIIAVTADAFESDRATMIDLGVNGFVSKPIKPEILFEAMTVALDKDHGDDTIFADWVG